MPSTRPGIAIVERANKSTAFPIFPLFRTLWYPSRYAKQVPLSAVSAARASEFQIYCPSPTPWVLEKMFAICSAVKLRSPGKAFVNDRLMNAACGRNSSRHRTVITATAAPLKPFSASISRFCFSLTLWSLKIRSNTKEITAGISSTNPAMDPRPYWNELINWSYRYIGRVLTFPAISIGIP